MGDVASMTLNSQQCYPGDNSGVQLLPPPQSSCLLSEDLERVEGDGSVPQPRAEMYKGGVCILNTSESS